MSRLKIVVTLRIAAFVYLSATIVVLGSERIYWYWTGLSGESVLMLGAFYAIPMAVALWALARTPGGTLHQIVLVGAVFAFVVEGVLTPVIYEDGPLPVLAVMFVGWHGLVSLVGLWYLTRKWLLERRLTRLAMVGAAFGAFWGVWALASSLSTLSDPADMAALAEDGLDVVLLEPARFAVYALGVGSILAVAHWLIGFVWPDRWVPARRSSWVVGGIAASYMAVAVIPIFVWAPLKLGLLLGAVWWLLRRSRLTRGGERSGVQRLAGRVRLRDTSVLLVMPIAAAAVYGMLWSTGVGDAAVVDSLLVLVQVVAGGAALVWAAHGAVRSTSLKVGG